MRVTALGAPRVSGPLQKYVAGTPIKPGAVLLMPATVRTSAASGDSGAVATLALESSAQAPSSAGMRLPQLAARIVGVEGSAPFRPTGVLLDKDAYATIGALAEGQTITIEATVKPSATTQTWNAVARLTGSDPAAAREVILLSAHIDHLGIRPSVTPDPIYNGADDDASGTAAVLELAHALASGPRPKRTIVFALFGSEESGGYGSRYFADRPVVPLTQIVANLEFEMIGRPDPKVAAHTLWLTGYERSNLGPALAKQGARLVQDPHPEQNFFTRSDNIQFARRGVIAHTVSSYGLHKQYHQPSDELTLIDFPHMTESIQSMLAPIRWLSNSTFRPQWVPGQKP
jgi:Zn-dependent M28 family amino/carboxypeptidase